MNSTRTPASQPSPETVARRLLEARDGYDRHPAPQRPSEQPSPAKRGSVRFQAYELDGVIADVEQGRGFDSICLDTIKRVRAVLAAQAAPVAKAQDSAASGEINPAELAKFEAACPAIYADHERELLWKGWQLAGGATASNAASDDGVDAAVLRKMIVEMDISPSKVAALRAEFANKTTGAALAAALAAPTGSVAGAAGTLADGLRKAISECERLNWWEAADGLRILLATHQTTPPNGDADNDTREKV
jgi:hypothetical protein